jgi:NAD(P)-dependent dehydrogenase (short-subunit alcohol dehydrogenase family)
MPPMTSLEDRVAVVTGAASGIGRALASGLASQGAHVALADVDEVGLAETAARVEKHGRRVLSARTDVARREDLHALADRAFRDFGGVHVLCNNAGVAVWGGLETATHEDWEWLIGVNLWGVIHGIEAFVPRMITQSEGGHVVNTASMAGLVATQGLGVYNTTKYAVVGLSETLQKDLRPYDIGVSVLCPMGVATRIREAGRNRPAHLRTSARPSGGAVELMGTMLTPERVADMVVAAIKANRLYIITHTEGLEPLRKRFRRMEQALEESQ